MLVLDDADLDAAVAGAVRGCFASAGSAVHLDRAALRPRVVAEEFTRRFRRPTSRTAPVHLAGWGGEMGSLASRSQFEVVAATSTRPSPPGATVLTGGAPRPDRGRWRTPRRS
jgi:succinate-semialdehyde dehydrogenase / glutarate-semialdehyde dehydrogenase